MGFSVKLDVSGQWAARSVMALRVVRSVWPNLSLFVLCLDMIRGL
jgi:hypothetical protein